MQYFDVEDGNGMKNLLMHISIRASFCQRTFRSFSSRNIDFGR